MGVQRSSQALEVERGRRRGLCVLRIEEGCRAVGSLLLLRRGRAASSSEGLGSMRRSSAVHGPAWDETYGTRWTRSLELILPRSQSAAVDAG
jgi:hypothetical protein